MALTFEVPSLRDNWRRAALVSFAVLACAGALVALVRTNGAQSTADSSGSLVAPEASKAIDSGVATTVLPSAAAGDDASAGGLSAPAATAPLVGPKIIRTADLRVRVKRGTFASAIDRATSIATSAGGYVGSSTTSSFAKGQGSGELSLRVPADRFDEVRRSLARLGTLESINLSGNDVTGQLVDLGARLKTLRAEEGSLDVLLGQARDIGQILQVRDRLTAVRTEIEQLAGQQAALQDQVAMATVRVSLHEAGAKVVHKADDDGTAFGDSVRTAVDALVAVVGGMVIVVGATLPFLVLALLAWPLVRRYGRRQAA